MGKQTHKEFKVDRYTTVRFVFDDGFYEHGIYDLDDVAVGEDERADTLRKLESGELLMLGAVVEHLFYGEWHQADSCWGICVTRSEDLSPLVQGMDTDRLAWLEGHADGLHKRRKELDEKIQRAESELGRATGGK